jgi:hypothetical protein
MINILIRYWISWFLWNSIFVGSEIHGFKWSEITLTQFRRVLFRDVSTSVIDLPVKSTKISTLWIRIHSQHTSSVKFKQKSACSDVIKYRMGTILRSQQSDWLKLRIVLKLTNGKHEIWDWFIFSGMIIIKLRMVTSLKSQASDWLKWRPVNIGANIL